MRINELSARIVDWSISVQVDQDSNALKNHVTRAEQQFTDISTLSYDETGHLQDQEESKRGDGAVNRKQSQRSLTF